MKKTAIPYLYIGKHYSMKNFSAIIVDDEKNIREAISLMMAGYCPEIVIRGTAASAAEARELLKKYSVDIILLDISMPWEDGFDLLNSIEREKYGVIFITAFEEYALLALKANAIDYLLKPVNPIELRQAVTKAISHLERRNINAEELNAYHNSLDQLNRMVRLEDGKIETVTVDTGDHLHTLTVSQLMYLQADGNDSILHLSGLEKIVSAITIAEFDQMLDKRIFFRIHQSTIINLNFLRGYSSGENCFAELSDNTRLSISRSRMDEFQKTVELLSKPSP
jgi:two-component system LytT family response regulator